MDLRENTAHTTMERWNIDDDAHLHFSVQHFRIAPQLIREATFQRLCLIDMICHGSRPGFNSTTQSDTLRRPRTSLVSGLTRQRKSASDQWGCVHVETPTPCTGLYSVPLLPSTHNKGRCQALANTSCTVRPEPPCSTTRQRRASSTIGG